MTCTSGYAFLNDEIYEVIPASFAHSGSGTYYLSIIQSTLTPSPLVYNDGTTKVAHINRQMKLVYYTSGLAGDYLSNFSRINAQGVRPGTVFDWYGDVSSNFDATGYGVNNMAGYAICNGNTFVGTATPDLRGKFIVAATNVPNTGAPALDSALGTYNQSDQGGEKAHALTSAENGPHTHTVTDPGHTHGVPIGESFLGAAGNTRAGNGANNPGNQLTTVSHTTGISIDSSGSGTAHNNLPPYFALIKIIKL